MTIQNMFNMAKGQTLTQDGCETDVDDKRYNIGDISQKTGLQKTANGWVKPKNGKAPGAKTGPGESPKNVYGAEVDKIYERQLKRIKELRAKGFTDEQIDNDKIIKQTKEDMKNVNKIDTTAAQKKLDELTKNKASFEERNKVAEQIKAANEYNYLVENLEKRGDKPTAEMQKKLTKLKAKAGSNPDPKLAKEIENGDHFERQKKEAAQKKRDEKLRQERREGEARADDFRKKVESGEIVYNKETGKFEDGKKATGSKPAESKPLLSQKDHVDIAKEVISNTLPGGSEWTAEEIAKEWKLGKADAEEVTKAIQALKTHKGVEKTLSNWEQAKKIKAGVEALEKKRNAGSKPAGAQEFIKIPTATGYAKVPKDAYSKYANNKTNVRLSNYIGEKMKGKSSNESNKFYDFVVKKIYESGDDPLPYLSQGGYSYPQRLLDMYYDEWNSKTNDCAPRVLTKDTKIRVRKA